MSLVSLYDAASLWMTPSGAEDGKLFSELPTDGSGDFTFSRGSNLAATRVGPTGLIEKGRENLLTQSNRFDLWNIKNVTSGHAGYDGTNNAWLQSGASRLQRNLTLSSSVYTGSIYVKAGFSDYVQLYLVGSSNALARFELIGNGTIVASSGIYPKIEPVSGATGWYRISTNINASITTFRIYPQNDSSGTQTADSSVYVQDAQLELGLATTDYIESGATTGKAGLLEDEPRLDYSGGATCPSLLLEPQRTNLVEYSEVFNLNWLASGRPAVETNIIDSPEGVQNGSRLTYGAGNVLRYQDELTFTNGYSYSIFVKKDVGRYVTIYAAFFTTSATIGFDLDEGTCQEGGVIEPYEDGWYRISVSKSVSGDADKSGYFYLYSADTLGGITSTPGNKLYVYGAQIEEGSYPTSYIPNHSGGSVTRGADAMNEQISGLTSIEQGTFFLDFDRGLTTATSRDASNDGFFYRSTSSFPNGDAIEVATEADGRARLALRLSSFTSIYLDNTLSRYKMLVKWEGTSVKAYVNGVLKYSSAGKWADATAALEYIGYRGDFRKSVNQVLTFPTALTDSECIKLTTL